MKNSLFSIFTFFTILFSGGTLSLLKDGGARDEDQISNLTYSVLFDYAQFIWLALLTTFVLFNLFVRRNYSKISHHPAALVTISVILISSLWAKHPFVSFRLAAALAVIYLFFNIYTITCGTDRALKSACNSLGAILILSVATAVFVPSYGISVGVHEGSWQGVFPHKNRLGNFATISLCFFLGASHILKKAKSTLLSLLAIFIILMSDSSTSIFSSIILIAIFMLSKNQDIAKLAKNLRRPISVFLVTVVIAVIYLSISSGQSSTENYDFNNRHLIWAYSIAKALESPIFGYGADQYSAMVAANDAGLANSIGFVVRSTHNGFIDAFYSFGIVGLALSYFFIYSALPGISTPNVQLYLLFSTASVCINIFESALFSFNYIIVLFILLATIKNPPSQRIHS